MIAISKNVYISKLDDIVKEYNNTYRTIKMKTIDVKDNTYIDFGKEVNDKDPKFKIGDHVRIKRLIKKKFRKEKVIKRKGDKLYVKWKGYNNSFNSWIEKKDLIYCIKMTQYFPKPYEPFGGGINVKVDLSNYATKTDIKNILHVDTSSFAVKANLANLKTEVDKVDIDKLVPVPTDFE